VGGERNFRRTQESVIDAEKSDMRVAVTGKTNALKVRKNNGK
jgi:hypothetical protein